MEEIVRNTDEIDEELSSQVKESKDMGQFTVKLEEDLQTLYSELCRKKYPPNTEVKGKNVPWWKDALNK